MFLKPETVWLLQSGIVLPKVSLPVTCGPPLCVFLWLHEQLPERNVWNCVNVRREFFWTERTLATKAHFVL